MKGYAVSGATTPGVAPSELGCLILFDAYIFFQMDMSVCFPRDFGSQSYFLDFKLI